MEIVKLRKMGLIEALKILNELTKFLLTMVDIISTIWIEVDKNGCRIESGFPIVLICNKNK